MKAAVLEEFNKPMKVHNDWPDPKCGPQDAIVRVEANGVCRSDWHVWAGDWAWLGLSPKLPQVIGHEFCGVVEEVGPQVTRVKRGDRVVCPFNFGCGACEFCLSGHQNTCANFQAAGFGSSGGYGRLADIPRADLNLVPLPERVPFVEASSMGCRFMTSFHGVVDQVKVQAGEWVAVHGCGGIGLAAIHIATALGANVIAVDIDDKKLAKAEEMGAVRTVNAKNDNAPSAVVSLTGGGAHVSIDALGVAETCLNSVMSLRTRGRHLQIGLTTQKEQGMVSLPVDMIVARELQVIGTIGMQPQRYPVMLRMVESGKLKPGKMVGRTIAIEQAGEVIASMGEYGTLGAVVVNQW
ncbi:MAG: zinc-dependent alcohol dehydrogenase family protein [Candidatus Binatia bacterium]